ncbi:MAG: translocation/assembly module TamB domain-containing protein, partial [Bacteroidota bacterium]
FNIGKFINIKEIGAVNMKLALSGSGLEKNNANINLNSQIASLDFNNIDIQDIQIDASFKKESLRLSISTIDKNVNANLSGIINLNQNKRNHYIFGGSINKIDLYNLGLFNTPLSISTNVNADFSASDINDYNGLISLNNINISDKEKFISFKDLAVSGITSDTGTRSLSIHSDFLNFKLNGIYTIDKLNSLGNQILAAYFPSYFHNDKIIEEINDFSFDLETNTIDDLLSIFKIPIHGANASRMSGKINTKLNEYKLEALIPNIYFGNIGFNDIHLESNNDNNLMKINGDIGLIELSDSLKIPNTQFLVRGAADTGFISIKTAMNQTFRDADLRTYFKISKEGILFNFLKSNFVLNEKIWSIENESDLFLSSKNILSDGIILSSGNESIKIFTHPSDIGSHNDITIEVRKLELGEILPFFLKDPIIEGTTTGRIDISDPFGKLYADVKLTSERFRINDDSIGLVPLQLTYNQSNKTFKYTINSENQKHIFNIKGYTNITKLDSIYTDNNIQLSSQSLALIEPYLDGIISNINGSATGLLNIRGYLNDIKLSGSAKLNNASFILDYTQCKYSVQAGAIIEFTENKIDFVNMLLKDIKGKSASFSGKITHSFFNDMFFDLHFEAMNKNKGILVLNTTAKDNSLFYGNVTAYANGTITGPVNNIKMKIMGRPTDSSKLFLPTSDSRVTGTASFIVFRQYGEDLRASSKLLNTSSVNVDLDVIANPYAKVYLILDEVTNDIIEGQGNGAINLKVGTHEKVSITGNYEIISGKYTFNWQYLFKRPFLINKGVINWSGDPYDARINIDANYMVEQVRLPNELTNGCSNERNNILVVANLSNTLKNPSIKFKFELPQGHPCRNNPLTNNGLTQLYNNPDELNRQVISLLLIGSFISNSQNQSFAGGSVGNTFVTSAAGTLSEFLAQQVESGLGAVIRNIPGLKDLKLDPYVTFTPGLITGTQAEGIGFQGTGSFGFTRRLMNGKLLLKAGGSMLVATGQNNNTVQNNRQLTPDISIEWLITPDGKLRLIGFYRTIFDIQRRNDRTGVSFSYLKEFDKIW